MRKIACAGIFLCFLFCLAGCGANQTTESIAAELLQSDHQQEETERAVQTGEDMNTAYTTDTITDPVFGDYGRLIFPVNSGYYSGDTLGDLRLTWYSNIDPGKTVDIANYMKDHAAAGDTIFFDIYTEEEKAADPEKEDTGLFFFKGNPGEKFAVCNAGGGFRKALYLQRSY